MISSIPGRWTLTATSFLLKSTALCTCARDAEANGVSLNDKKISQIWVPSNHVKNAILNIDKNRIGGKVGFVKLGLVKGLFEEITSNYDAYAE